MTPRLLRITSALLISLLALPAALAEQALVSVSVGSLRAEPRQGAELETQALMGTPVELTDSTADGEWHLAVTPDGYRAWINCSAIARRDSVEMLRWRKSPRVIVTAADQTWLTSDGSRVTDLVNGCILETLPEKAASPYKIAVRTPDGRTGELDRCCVEDLYRLARRDTVDTEAMMDLARSMMGVPYLWGGTSTKMIDCSGYTFTLFRHAAGLILPRNASRQALIGERISGTDSLRRGDLLFFLNPATGKVNHVGVYDADGWFYHATGRVRRDNILPGHPQRTTKIYSHAVRLFDPATHLPYPGLTRLKSSPLYF